jgi:16S rRNA (cytidine1402-2'-O)-methyltransferase
MLSIVSTPIGNLGDITLRAMETLKNCDAIVCEDMRVTGSLLKHLHLEKKPLISMHGYSNPKKIDDVLDRLRNGEHLVLVSDAGTPGISDPGYALTSKVANANVQIEVLPGASAFLAALSVSGLPINQFVYLGFLPQKKGRQTLLASFKDEKRTIVFYESVHRIERTISELANALQNQSDRPIVIARELTKMHEEVIRSTVKDIQSDTKGMVVKGEFVVVVGAV